MTNSVALPVLEPLVAPLSEEEKRARQRLHVKRTYYRKLQREHAQLSSAAVVPVPAIVDGSLTDTSPVKAKPLHVSYAELLRVKEELRSQNEAMRCAVADYQRFSQKLEMWLEADTHQPVHSMTQQQLSRLAISFSGEESPNASSPTSSSSSPPSSSSSWSSTSSMGAHNPHVPTLIAPISEDVCRNLARSTYADMERFRDSQSFDSTGVSVFGWRDKRRRDGDLVKFSLTKTFYGITAFDLWLRGWSVMASCRRLPSLYTQSLNVQIFMLQEVDEDNHVMFRLITSPDGRYVIKTLFLASRFELDCGRHVILLRSLDRRCLAPYRVPPGVLEKWIDYYCWVTLAPFGERGEHCKLDFGGEVQSNPVLGTDTWMLELLLIALRWECQVIGPIFSLCSTSDNEFS
ncbi:hypothetical protein PINS_up007072 [Pythium insidiosum]|nr:hypothetical protein PINS_up007072 [Pythium insidiosum]